MWPDGYSIKTDYDALNRPLSFKEDGTVLLVTLATYAWDDFTRCGTLLRKTYSYDPTGNRMQRGTYDTVNGIEQRTATQTLTTVADSNRMLQNDSWAMTLSAAAGNTLRQSQNLVYAYNDQGRLNEVCNPTNLYANYSYNALGQRTLKRIFSANNAASPTATYSYLYGADGQLLGQKTYNSNGKPDKAQYWVWLDGQPVAGIELEYTGKGAVNKTSQYYLHSDHLNTPRMATNQSQTLLWSWNSDAFGFGGVNGDTHGNKPSLDILLRFPGQLYDTHTAMNYNYFRDYDPNTGRYIQSDPIGLQGGINTYQYALSNPLNFIDPTGLDITISFNGSAAAGAGHVGIGVNSPNTVGQRPQAGQNSVAIVVGQNVPGQISLDPVPDARVVIPTTPRQDRQAQQCIDTRTREQQNYNLYQNNCAQFVGQCLSAAGVQVPNTRYPRILFDDIQGQFGGGR